MTRVTAVFKRQRGWMWGESQSEATGWHDTSIVESVSFRAVGDDTAGVTMNINRLVEQMREQDKAVEVLAYEGSGDEPPMDEEYELEQEWQRLAQYTDLLSPRGIEQQVLERAKQQQLLALQADEWPAVPQMNGEVKEQGKGQQVAAAEQFKAEAVAPPLVLSTFNAQGSIVRNRPSIHRTQQATQRCAAHFVRHRYLATRIAAHTHSRTEGGYQPTAAVHSFSARLALLCTDTSASHSSHTATTALNLITAQQSTARLSGRPHLHAAGHYCVCPQPTSSCVSPRPDITAAAAGRASNQPTDSCIRHARVVPCLSVSHCNRTASLKLNHHSSAASDCLIPTAAPACTTAVGARILAIRQSSTALQQPLRLSDKRQRSPYSKPTVLPVARPHSPLALSPPLHSTLRSTANSSPPHKLPQFTL